MCYNTKHIHNYVNFTSQDYPPTVVVCITVESQALYGKTTRDSFWKADQLPLLFFLLSALNMYRYMVHSYECIYKGISSISISSRHWAILEEDFVTIVLHNGLACPLVFIRNTMSQQNDWGLLTPTM